MHRDSAARGGMSPRTASAMALSEMQEQTDDAGRFEEIPDTTANAVAAAAAVAASLRSDDAEQGFPITGLEEMDNGNGNGLENENAIGMMGEGEEIGEQGNRVERVGFARGGAALDREEEEDRKEE